LRVSARGRSHWNPTLSIDIAVQREPSGAWYGATVRGATRGFD
jgi:hypothetical protein